MNSTEKNIDQLIREALSEDESRSYEELGEQSVISMALGIFSGRNRYLMILMGIITVIFFAAGVYSGIKAYNAIQTNELIRWTAAFFFFMMGVMGLKIWSWMEMEKNATIRELKRVELQIVNLANRLHS